MTFRPTGAQAAINLLVSKDVFAIISTSDFFFTDDRPVEQAGIPVLGGITDGPEYGEQPFTNMIDIRGDVDSTTKDFRSKAPPSSRASVPTMSPAWPWASRPRR